MGANMKRFFIDVAIMILITLSCWGAYAEIHNKAISRFFTPTDTEETEWVVAEEIEPETSIETKTKKDIDTDVLIQVCAPNLDAQVRALYVPYIDKYSEMYNIPKPVVCSVITYESSWNPVAWSKEDGQGLMQLVPKWHKERIESYGATIDRLWDLETNIRGGCHYLSDLYKRFGQADLVFAAYNAGPTKVAKLGRVPRYRETLDYVHNILVLIEKLNRIRGEP
jgi:soluble lytic murein transglycosylase